MYQNRTQLSYAHSIAVEQRSGAFLDAEQRLHCVNILASNGHTAHSFLLPTLPALDFVFKMMNFALQTMNFVLTMIHPIQSYAPQTCP